MPLKTETNTLSMGRRAKAAAFDAGLGHVRDLQADFEHGQWWITNRRTGAQWSVCDASGPGTFDGFSFEQATEAK
jgi:hypothetical protein